MVLGDKREYSSLSRFSSDSATVVWVTHSNVSTSRSKLILRSPMTLAGASLAPQQINEAQYSKTPQQSTFRLATGDSNGWSFRVSARDSSRVEGFLRSQNVNLREIPAAPIVPSNQKQKQSQGSSQQGAPTLPNLPSNLPSGPIAGSALVDEMFRGLDKTRLERPRRREPPMLSGENGRNPDLALKRRRLRTEKTESPKAASASPKSASPQAAVIPDGLVDPTPGFLESISKTHNPIKFPHQDGRSTHIALNDIGRLEENVFLDDTLISFFLKRYHEQMPNSASTHVFSTFFYPRIGQNIQKWIQKVDFSTKNLLVVPIHQNSHWSAAVVLGTDAYIAGAGPPPKIIYFDSLAVTHTGARDVFKKCVQFLGQVLEARGVVPPTSRRYTKIIAQVPVQSNLSDCGVFMLAFMQHVMENSERFAEILASGTKFNLEDVYTGELHTRSDLLEVLQAYGNKHPYLATESGDESELEEAEVPKPAKPNKPKLTLKPADSREPTEPEPSEPANSSQPTH